MELHINAYLRAVAPQGRESEQVGPFLATCTTTTDNPYLNYAIPDDHARPSVDDAHALVSWFETRRRKPRLEYVTAEAPEVELALMAAGFVAEGRLPVMVWDIDSPATPQPVGIEILVPKTDSDLLGLMTVTAEAYGSDARPSPDDLKRTRLASDRGAGAIIARDVNDGRVVGAGTFPPIVDGVTEVAAIGVATTHRRRGIAQALARRLAQEAVGRGARAPFLMAAHEAEEGIYQRAGFRTIGTILHIST